MSPEESAKFKARLHRLRASRYRTMAAWEELNATVAEASIAAANFVALIRAAETREVAEHPDLAELNLQLDGYYGDHL